MRVKNIVLGLGIFIVYLLALFQGVETFFPSPQYDDYCDFPNRVAVPIPGKGSDCEFNQELTNRANSCYQIGGEFVYEYDADGCAIGGECDECRIGYDEALDAYANQLFLISVVLGVVVFFIGLYLLKKEPVGSALIASAIFTLVYGTARNWRNFTEAWRFLILFVLLILLIWLTMRLNTAGKKRGFSLVRLFRRKRK